MSSAVRAVRIAHRPIKGKITLSKKRQWQAAYLFVLPFFVVFIGMLVVITDNMCVELGIANGSRAIVVRLQLFDCSRHF